MDGNGRDNDGARYILSQDRKTDCGNNTKNGRQRGMGVGLGGHGFGGYTDLTNKGVHEEAAGNNHVVCSRDADI